MKISLWIASAENLFPDLIMASFSFDEIRYESVPNEISLVESFNKMRTSRVKSLVSVSLYSVNLFDGAQAEIIINKKKKRKIF